MNDLMVGRRIRVSRKRYDNPKDPRAAWAYRDGAEVTYKEVGWDHWDGVVVALAGSHNGPAFIIEWDHDHTLGQHTVSGRDWKYELLPDEPPPPPKPKLWTPTPMTRNQRRQNETRILEGVQRETEESVERYTARVLEALRTGVTS